jgi:hypothetical protein
LILKAELLSIAGRGDVFEKQKSRRSEVKLVSMGMGTFIDYTWERLEFEMSGRDTQVAVNG